MNYDTEEDRIITNGLNSFGYNSWVEYDDPAIICVGNYSFLIGDINANRAKHAKNNC